MTGPRFWGLWRHFLRSTWLQAAVCALLGISLTGLLSMAAPGTFTMIDYALYDVWLSHRGMSSVSPSLVVITRDAATDERFGPGPWDRAVLAELVTAIHDSGARAIGLDLELDHQHIACERCERVWCAVCIGRAEIEISPEWLKRRAVAHLN